MTHSQDSVACSVASSTGVFDGEGVPAADACSAVLSVFVAAGERFVGSASATN